MTPPLRFLTLVLGGWLCLRALLLGSAWWEVAEAGPAPAPTRSVQAPDRAIPLPQLVETAHLTPLPPLPAVEAARTPAATEAAPLPPVMSQTMAVAPSSTATPAPTILPGPIGTPLALAPPRRSGDRWSASVWLFVRDGERPALAPGGTLGGSQAGGWIAYRLNDNPAAPVALSARTYAPLEYAGAAEAALGLDWRPVEGIPLHLLAERRQALGENGRSAFALTVYGGVGDVEAGPLRIDAYGQAGVVGTRSRDLFADGSARLSLPVGKAKIGIGAWGAAQPGVERLEAGPQTSLRLPVAGANVVVALDWRMRVAGDAEPGGGPTLTLATDF